MKKHAWSRNFRWFRRCGFAAFRWAAFASVVIDLENLVVLLWRCLNGSVNLFNVYKSQVSITQMTHWICRKPKFFINKNSPMVYMYRIDLLLRYNSLSLWWSEPTPQPDQQAITTMTCWASFFRSRFSNPRLF